MIETKIKVYNDAYAVTLTNQLPIWLNVFSHTFFKEEGSVKRFMTSYAKVSLEDYIRDVMNLNAKLSLVARDELQNRDYKYEIEITEADGQVVYGGYVIIDESPIGYGLLKLHNHEQRRISPLFVIDEDKWGVYNHRA